MFYQSPMHPWITSDKPGACTICGMKLVPVYDKSEAASLEKTTMSLSDASRQLLGVATEPVKREPLQGQIRVSGILEDDDTFHRVVAAFYEGRIEKVYVQQVGQRVVAGEPLAAVYSPELLYVVREYQAAIQRGKNDPVAVNSRHRLIQYGLAPAQVDAIGSAPRDVYTVDVLAPTDGTVLVRNAWQGQYVKNGERLFETGNLAKMWFKAEVYERDIAGIQIGQKATVTSPVAPGRTFEGVVTFIDPTFDAISRSAKVRIEVANPLSDQPGGLERQLPHRAFAEAVIDVTTPAALSVPRSALLRDGRREIVFVENAPSEFDSRPVKAGAIIGDRAVIVDGLTEGENVVISGNLLLDAEVQLKNGGVE